MVNHEGLPPQPTHHKLASDNWEMAGRSSSASAPKVQPARQAAQPVVAHTPEPEKNDDDDVETMDWGRWACDSVRV